MTKEELEDSCFRRMNYALLFLAVVPTAIIVFGLVMSILDKG